MTTMTVTRTPSLTELENVSPYLYPHIVTITISFHSCTSALYIESYLVLIICTTKQTLDTAHPPHLVFIFLSFSLSLCMVCSGAEVTSADEETGEVEGSG